MEFTGQYLSYADYRTLGGTLDQASFNLIEFEARRQIDERTQYRLKNIDYENVTQEIKLCMYKLINSIEKYAETMITSSNGVKSENIDGYSISYLTASEITSVITSKASELNDIITTYLYGVVVNGEHILYVGVK